MFIRRTQTHSYTKAKNQRQQHLNAKLKHQSLLADQPSCSIFYFYICFSFLLFLQSGKVIPMPVPSSYNDITEDRKLRDFIGWVWYEKEVYVPRSWETNITRVVLRFESSNYNTIVVRSIFFTFTIMIQFSARGTQLLLVPQGRALIRDRVLVQDRALT